MKIKTFEKKKKEMLFQNHEKNIHKKKIQHTKTNNNKVFFL